MRKKLKNDEYLEGYLYNHKLAIKTVQDTQSKNYGVEFINGEIFVATDEECLNVVPVHFTFVTAVTSTKKVNETFKVLKEIIETGKCVETDGKEAAMKIKVSTSLGLNDFYTNRDGEEKLVSAKRNEGGFVYKINKFSTDREHNSFKFDILINKVTLVEADEEKKIPNDYLIIRGGVFDFRNAILPVDLICKSKSGINYFQSLDVNERNPIFTQVWGSINSETIVSTVTTESAFGDPVVQEYSRSIKEWVVTGAKTEPYEIGNAEEGITIDEIKELISNRETYLANVKRRQDEYVTANAATSASFLGF